MPNDAPISSYNFVWTGGDHNVYAFTTNDEIGYEVKFVPSGYLFEDYIDDPVDAYEMVIAVVDNPAGGRLPADSLTAPTIRAIFYAFFRSHEQVIIFICDSSDGRQLARFRKFTDWYYKDISAIQPGLFKMDARVVDSKNQHTLLSGILRTSHPHFSVFVALFRDLNAGVK
ncbi:MAG: hypothetical protein H7Z72_01115 [Bacteroidetes bacterium]|nr:hypothetical protein [Fibrella sp.]